MKVTVLHLKSMFFHGILSVFPTDVGVNPIFRCFFSVFPGLPHRRGGVSSPTRQLIRNVLSSPRAWG